MLHCWYFDMVNDEFVHCTGGIFVYAAVLFFIVAALSVC
jgi:hypothetical protein